MFKIPSFKNRIAFFLVAILSMMMLIAFFVPRETGAQDRIPSGLVPVPRNTILWPSETTGKQAIPLANTAVIGENGQVYPLTMTRQISDLYQQLYDPQEGPPYEVVLRNKMTNVILPINTWGNLVANSLELIEERQRVKDLREGAQSSPESLFESEPITLLLKLLDGKPPAKYKATLTYLDILDITAAKQEPPPTRYTAQPFLNQFESLFVPPEPEPVTVTCSSVKVVE